ncbi:MAG: hypothetical protein LBP20_10905 [Treponema sp.]|jgi:hypothetical protein|nr:hypothetical protein [Treponema sp.]
MNTQRIFANEMEALCLMPVSGPFDSMGNSGTPEPVEWRPAGAEPFVMGGLTPDQGGERFSFPRLALDDEDIEDEEDSFDDMEEDFDDDFDDDEDDDFDYDDDADYDDDIEE